MKFCRSHSYTICKSMYNSSFAILHTRCNLGKQDIIILKICKAFFYFSITMLFLR